MALCGVGSSCHWLPDTAPWALKSISRAAQRPLTAGSTPFQEHHHIGYPLLGPSLQLLKLGVIFAAFPGVGVWRDLASSL